MMGKSFPCHLFPFCAGLTVIAVRVNGDTPAGQEFSPNLNIFGIHELYQIIHDDIHAVFMEIAVIPEAE